MAFSLYILYGSIKDKYYIGISENVINRLAQHNSGKNKSTRFGIPWELKKIENFESRAEAMKREKFIKQMKSRKFIEMVINHLR
jgi:putative endonuclease